MKGLNIIYFVLLVVTFAAFADVAQAKSNNVLTLDSSNFNAMCTKYPRILALFTASKCEACTKFGPQFADLSKDFASSKDELVFASITCTKEESLCQKFNVATLPTLIVLDKCEPGIRYRGKYNAIAVAEFVRKYLVSPVITLQGKDELAIFKKDLSRLGVVGYFESKEDPRYEPFLQASRLHINQYPYGVVIDEDPEEYGIHDIPAIVMYKQGKEYHYRIPRDVTGNSIVEWVNENSLLFLDTIPLGELEELIRTSFASVGVFWLPEDYPQSDLAQFDILKEAFPTYFFVKVYVKPSDKETVNRIVSSAIDIEQQLPAFTFIHLTTEIYPLEEGDDFIAAHIRELLNGFLEGTARLVQKSAPLPDPEQEKNKIVKTLVFDNFHPTVDQSQHDSVIIMHSKRHCLNCEEILSTLKQLAEIIRQKHGEDEIVFGEYDIDDNFVPELLTDVPTLFYFRAGQMNAPRSISRNLNKISVLFNLIKNSASFDFDVELPTTIAEDHDEADISPENMGVAQEQPDPQDFFGDVEGGNEEPLAPWMNNPIVVSSIDDNTLQKFIDEHERVLLVFVENVNAQADLLEQIGTLSQMYGDRIAFGKVEAKNAPQMIAFFGIKEFPALKYFSLQEAVDMRELEAFTLPSLEIFLWRHLDDYAHKFDTAKELEAYVTNEEGKTFWTPKLIVLGGVFTSNDLKNPAFRSFMKISEHLLSSVQSGYVVYDNIGLPEEYGLESVPALMLYSKGKRVAVLPMKDDALLPISELSQWVLDNGIPTVTEFSPYLYTNLYWNLKPLVVLFIDQSKTAEATEHIKMLEEVCTEFKGKVHCTYANGSDPQLVDSHMLQWDLNPEKLPAAVIEAWHVRDDGEYYPMRVDVTKESLRDHINKVLNKEIKAHVRSEPVVPFAALPEITKVVRNNLEEFINQPDKEVLLYFTHSDERGCPSCPRVDKAAQKWAKKFAKYTNVALGQFDVYRNDLPFSLWREINQVPALLYYRSTNKQEPLKYIKSLEFKDLKDFLVNNGATLHKVKSDKD